MSNWYTVESLSTELHVCEATVRRAIWRNDLRAHKVGRVWRVRFEDAQAWVGRAVSEAK